MAQRAWKDRLAVSDRGNARLTRPTDQKNDTKQAILDAAERLFAQHGFHAGSLRVLTSGAGVNLGAVNYHFSSKDALILAVLRRRIHPLNQERLAMLSTCEKQAGKRPVPVEKILEALFRPALELATSPAKGGRYFVRLVAQCLAEPAAFLRPLIEEEFAEYNRRFHLALSRALPHLSSRDIHWRLHFVQGALLHTLAHADLLELWSNGQCRVTNVDSPLGRIIDFCAAGLKAALSKTERKHGSRRGTSR
jgi:AcrR family transcriptional regulator